ncbi:efflux RND transporter periplasmic adaptor subunit, partial [Enterobacter intestinihominis]
MFFKSRKPKPRFQGLSGGVVDVYKRKQQYYLAVGLVGVAGLTGAGRERLALQVMPEEVIRLLERSGKPQTTLILRTDRA